MRSPFLSHEKIHPDPVVLVGTNLLPGVSRTSDAGSQSSSKKRLESNILADLDLAVNCQFELIFGDRCKKSAFPAE